MSRIRTIKPEFWSSEQVISCSPLARLLFIGLWNFADDHGVHQASHVRLKAEVFPIDNINPSEIKKLIDELISEGLLREYIVNKKAYWIITGWSNHQRIDKPTYRHPLPVPDLMSQNLLEQSENNNRQFDESSTNPRRALDEPSATERKGKEWNGMEWKNPYVGFKTDLKKDKLAEVDLIFEHWKKTMNHLNAKLDSKRKTLIKNALKIGYTATQLCNAITGCSYTPHNIGQNDRGQRFDGLNIILRNADQIDRFISNCKHPPAQITHASKIINTMDEWAQEQPENLEVMRYER